ncbi:glycosyltransferase family 2 protein [Solibacillus sp. CAU 1738]|uniref:glycosyltransferase family 2 protein n=1 Tax=Solibacillus sp. CAU 1738 TaxID=3140363 RepID=UPI003261AA88
MVSISYIIPTFNNLELLKRCIYSIEPQLKSEDKIIIINDGSNDGTKEYLNENFTKKRNYIILNQPNKGSGSARNLGLERCDTDYIWFVDADDFLVADARDRINEVLESNHYDLLFIGYSIKINSSEIENKEIQYDPQEKIGLFMTEHYPWNKVISKKLFQNIYFPNENIRFQDQATIPVIISKARTLGAISKPLYIYDMSHPNNISKNSKKNKDIYAAFLYLNKHYKKQNLKKEEIEALYIKKFIFDEAYHSNINILKIYLNLRKVYHFLEANMSNWGKSALLKQNEISKYNHIIKYVQLKAFIGKVISISPLAASFLIFFFKLSKRVIFFIWKKSSGIKYLMNIRSRIL